MASVAECLVGLGPPADVIPDIDIWRCAGVCTEAHFPPSGHYGNRRQRNPARKDVGSPTPRHRRISGRAKPCDGARFLRLRWGLLAQRQTGWRRGWDSTSEPFQCVTGYRGFLPILLPIRFADATNHRRAMHSAFVQVKQPSDLACPLTWRTPTISRRPSNTHFMTSALGRKR
jgi:hypothetical protein